MIHIETDKIPIRIISSANIKEHWSRKYKREKKQKEMIRIFASEAIQSVKIPVQITFVRIAPRSLDDDNLAYSLKAHRDFICSLLIPGLAPGRADNNEGISIVYKQEKGAPKEYALKIIFEIKEDRCSDF